MHRRTVLLLLLAAVLVLGACMPGAMAYFTQHIVAVGGYPIRLGGTSGVEEDVSAWTKHLAVSCAEDSEAVFVRAKAFCGSLYTLRFDDENGLWTQGVDGYYYYGEALLPGQTTETLHVSIDNVPKDPEHGDSFHVIVVYETTPVLYTADGQPYADWNVALQGTAEEGGAAP